MRDAPELPGFRLERLLGEGAQGRVYLAHETGGLQRPVALKVFRAGQRAPFEAELRVLRQVEELRRRAGTDVIVQALGTGEHAEQGWIALEWLEGGSLAERLEQGPLSWEQAAPLARDLGGALALLHAGGLFHRDVKPQNVLLGADGRARLGDFGLSRALDGTLSAAGSPAFAAPEVIAGKPSDGRRVDVYSLGATLYRALSGETMLPGRPDVFALERAGVPRDVQQALATATAAVPAERTADVSRFLQDLGLELPEFARTVSAPADAPGGSETMKTGAKPSPQPAREPEPVEGLAVQHPRCPYCHEAVDPADKDKQGCPECMAWHHHACWSEQGGCAACGARAAARDEQVAVPPQRPAPSGWRRTLAILVGGLLSSFLVLGALFLGGPQLEEAPTAQPPVANAVPVPLPDEPEPRDVDLAGDQAPAAQREATPNRKAYLSGVRALQSGNLETARDRFQVALRLDPQDYRAQFKLGVVAFGLGDAAEERRCYEQALALNPDYAPAWINLGHNYLGADELERAQQAYERAIALEPEKAKVWFNLGLVEYDLGQKASAAERFQRVLELQPGGDAEQQSRRYLAELHPAQGD